MNKASTNGSLTKEQFLALTTFEEAVAGLGTFKYRRIGSAEYEALWPMPPEIAETWPKVDGASPEEIQASRRIRREAEAAWLRTLPDADQIRWRSNANDVRFRVIAACCLSPRLTVDEARALGDDIEYLYAAILMRSGLLTPDPKPTPTQATAAPDSAPVAQ